MKTNIKEAARTPACISAGDEFPEPHMEQYTVHFPPAPASWTDGQQWKTVEQPMTTLIDFNKLEGLMHIEPPKFDTERDRLEVQIMERLANIIKTPPVEHAIEERVIPLPWYLTADEWLQRRMPWNGLTLAAAIVLAIAVGVLLGHAWGRLG